MLVLSIRQALGKCAAPNVVGAGGSFDGRLAFATRTHDGSGRALSSAPAVRHTPQHGRLNLPNQFIRTNVEEQIQLFGRL